MVNDFNSTNNNDLPDLHHLSSYKLEILKTNSQKYIKSKGLSCFGVAAALSGTLTRINAPLIYVVICFMAFLTIAGFFIYFDKFLPYNWWKQIGAQLAGINLVHVSLSLGLVGAGLTFYDNKWTTLALIYCVTSLVVVGAGTGRDSGNVIAIFLQYVRRRVRWDVSRVTHKILYLIALLFSILIVVGVFQPWIQSNGLSISGWSLSQYIHYGITDYNKAITSFIFGIFIAVFSVIALVVLHQRSRIRQSRILLFSNAVILVCFLSAVISSAFFSITRDGFSSSCQVSYGLVISLVGATLGLITGFFIFIFSLPNTFKSISRESLCGLLCSLQCFREQECELITTNNSRKEGSHVPLERRKI
ncbi:MAG: hypothetical protein WC562_08435 [Dehalococcoidia bacterium]